MVANHNNNSSNELLPLRSLLLLVLPLALLRLALYLIAAPHYGYFRDELYFLACGEHPAWGYVDQPPMIAWAAWLLQHSIGTSLYALRLLPMLTGIASILFTALIARELGGKRWSIFLSALAVAVTPILLANANLFTMNAFDALLWTAIAYLLLRIDTRGDAKLWLPLGALIGITLLNKYAVLFWLAAVLLAMLLTSLRRAFLTLNFWLGVVLATLIALPNFLWQWSHHFPFVELLSNIRKSGRDVQLSPLKYLASQAEMLGYLAALLVLVAICFQFTAKGAKARVLTLAFLFFLAEMILLHGKMYYVAPAYPAIFALGAVGFEAATRARILSLARPLFALLVATLGLLITPVALPLLSVPQFLAYEKTLGVKQQKFEHSKEGVLPQLYADMFGWEPMVRQVAAYYKSLSPAEQRSTAIITNNYGEGGAIDFFGPQYGLPKSIGVHQNYWIWGPRQYTGSSLIVLGEGDEKNMQDYCTTYSIVGQIHDDLSRPDEWKPIYHCRGFKLNLQKDWAQLKRYR